MAIDRRRVGAIAIVLLGGAFGFLVVGESRGAGPAAHPRVLLGDGSPGAVRKELERRLDTGRGIRIAGVVRTADGQPLEGVAVFLEFSRIEPADPFLAAGDRERHVRDAVRALLKRKTGAVRVWSGPDGRYTMEGLAFAPSNVAAWREGYRIQRAGPWPDFPPGRTATVDFLADPVSSEGLKVTVQDPDGRTAESARVSWVSDGGSRWEADWRPDAPDLLAGMLAGSYKLSASRGPWLRSDPVRVELSAVRGSGVTLRLRPVLGIQGKVEFPEQDMLDEVLVRCVQAGGGLDQPAGGQAPGPADLRVTEQAPGFVFVGLAHGEHEVLVESPGYGTSSRTPVRVEGGVVELVLPVPAPAPHRSVLLAVYDPDGRPLQDFSAVCRLVAPQASGKSTVPDDPGRMGGEHQGNGGSAPAEARAAPHEHGGTEHSHGGEGRPASRPPLRRRDGRVLVGLAEEAAAVLSGEAPGKLFLEVSSPMFGDLALDVPGRERPELEARFRRPAELRIDVSAAGNSDRFAVTLQRSDGLAGYSVPADPAGGFVLAGLQPGEYLLETWFSPGPRGPDASSGLFALSTVPLRLESGTNRWTFPLPSLYPVAIVLEEAVAEVRAPLSLWLRQPEGSWSEWYRAHTRARRFEPGELPAGSYFIGLKGIPGEQEFLVPLDGELRFAPTVQESPK